MERHRGIKPPFPAWQAGVIIVIRMPHLVGRERLELPVNLIRAFTVLPDAISGHQPSVLTAGLEPATF